MKAIRTQEFFRQTNCPRINNLCSSADGKYALASTCSSNAPIIPTEGQRKQDRHSNRLRETYGSRRGVRDGGGTGGDQFGVLEPSWDQRLLLFALPVRWQFGVEFGPTSQTQAAALLDVQQQCPACAEARRGLDVPDPCARGQQETRAALQMPHESSETAGDGEEDLYNNSVSRYAPYFLSTVEIRWRHFDLISIWCAQCHICLKCWGIWARNLSPYASLLLCQQLPALYHNWIFTNRHLHGKNMYEGMHILRSTLIMSLSWYISIK